MSETKPKVSETFSYQGPVSIEFNDDLHASIVLPDKTPLGQEDDLAWILLKMLGVELSLNKPEGKITVHASLDVEILAR